MFWSRSRRRPPRHDEVVAHIDDGLAVGATSQLATALQVALARSGTGPHDVAFACIGSDRSTGDALGPLVGEGLVALGVSDERVIGTLAEPVHALNVNDHVSELRDSTIVAVDAALGPPDAIGSLTLRMGGLRPGAAVGKLIRPVGDLSLVATVNSSQGPPDAETLQGTRLYLVSRLAETIAAACWWATTRAAGARGIGRAA